MIWFLAWFPFALGHLHDPLLTSWANAPYGVNALANTSQPLLALVAAPVTVLWGPIASFNVLMAAAFTTSAASGYALARRFTTWRPAAFVGGLLYGFSPYMIGQGSVGHLNLVFVPIPPLILSVLYDLVVSRHVRAEISGLALAGLVVVQYFISSEVLASTLLVAVGVLVVVALMHPRSIRGAVREAVRGIAIAGVISVAALAYPVWFSLAGPQHIVGPIQATPQQYRADLVASVVPDRLQAIAPNSATAVSDKFMAEDTPENGSYLGVPLVLVLGAGTVVLWRRRPAVPVVAIAAAATFLLSLGARLVVSGTPDPYAATGLRLPETLLDHVPVLRNAQPSRFALYTALFASLLLAVILDALRLRLRTKPAHRKRPTRGLLATAGPAAVAVFALAPLVPAWPFAAGPTSVPAYFAGNQVDAVPPGSTALLYPFPAWASDGALSQVWQATAGMRFRIVGGYFLVPQAGTGLVAVGRASTTASTLQALEMNEAPAQTDALRTQLRSELASWQVRTVLAEPAGANPSASLSFLSWLVGRPPVRQGGIEAWYDIDWKQAS